LKFHTSVAVAGCVEAEESGALTIADASLAYSVSRKG
jgi:hypothetical protein